MEIEIIRNNLTVIAAVENRLLEFLESCEDLRIEEQREDYTISYAFQFYRALQNLVRIIPHSAHFRFLDDQMNMYNLSSIASLTRNLWDVFIAFIFHISDATSQDRFEYKNILQHYLAEKKRLQIFEEGDPESPHMEDLKATADDAFSALESRSEYQALKREIKKKVKGSRFTPPAKNLLRNLGIPTEFYSSLHTYLSNHTHFYSYGFTQDISFSSSELSGQATMQMVMNYAEIVALFFQKELFKELNQECENDLINSKLRDWEQFFHNEGWKAR